MVLVGFANNIVTVTEGGDFSECVAVTQPTPDVPMEVTFYLLVDVIPLTAGMCVFLCFYVCFYL